MTPEKQSPPLPPPTFATILANNWQFGKRGLVPTALAGLLLGITGTIGLAIFFSSTNYWNFGVYLTALSIFHLLEFLLTATFHPRDVTFDSFLLNHSTAYQAAVVMALAEYWLEVWIFGTGGLKTMRFSFVLGVLLILIGQSCRTLAMWTGGVSFTHLIAEQRRPEHQLVQHGIFSILRHPSYFGHFYMSLGTQLVLNNPISLAAYAGILWKFFKQRIHYEEVRLVEFFGPAYENYRRRTITGIPGLA